MPFELLHQRIPSLAIQETRVITVLEKSRQTFNLPAADYTFMEMFCNEAGCDCRRVFFLVVSSVTQDSEAVICYGWETRAFYQKWFKQGTKEDIDSLQGPDLNLGSPQGRYADAILKLFTHTLLPQTDYIDRVKRHYLQFRATVERPRNPLFRRRKTGG